MSGVVACRMCGEPSRTDIVSIKPGAGLPRDAALLMLCGNRPTWICAGCVRVANTVAAELGRALLEEKES